MALPLPNLDDRRWTDLVDEGRTLIPVHAPDWTDHNAHDPGITFIELFAFLAELDLYRLNRVPPAHVRKFLALLDSLPRPPRAARTVVAFGLPAGSASAGVPADLEVLAEAAGGTRAVFRTLASLTVVPLRVSALLRGTPPALADASPAVRRGETVPLFGDDPSRGVCFYLGFDQPLPAGVPVSLYFCLDGGKSDWPERERILEEARRAAEACAPPVPPAPCTCGHTDDEDGGGQPAAGPVPLPPHSSVRLAWEVQIAPDIWLPLEGNAVQDDTRSLTLDGAVVVTVPVATVASAVAPEERPLHYLRCRLASGSYDAAPALVALAVNGVAAEQAEAVTAQALPPGDDQPFQRLALPQAPVQDGRLDLETRDGSVTAAWTQRGDFDLSGRTDAHYTLDATQGIILCGDGERGRRLRATEVPYVTYRATLAAAGNVAAGRVHAIVHNAHNQGLPGYSSLPGSLSVTNPVAAAGGAAAETLEQAALRAMTSVEARLRAVTTEDFEGLALATPGTHIARAAARPSLDAALPCLEAVGVVTVVVLPRLPLRRPMPSSGTRRAVAAYLARRRVVGTRVVVVGPEYREITVSARVRALRGVDPARLREAVVAALDRFFHALQGGPDGKGWPFGRSVYRSEVLQVLDETPGVDHVLGLELVVDGEARCGNLCLGPIGLPVAGAHQIEVVS